MRARDVVVAVLGALVALSPALSPPAHAMVGGRAAPAGRLAPAARWHGSCSGVLVSPRIVLLALHCIEARPGLVPGDAVGTTVRIGNPNGRRPAQRRTVIGAATAPQALSAPDHSPDLGVLQLDRPSDLPAARLPATAEDAAGLSAPDSPLLIAGFGTTSATDAEPLAAILGEAALQSSPCAASAGISAERALYTLCAVSAQAPSFDGVPGGVPCFGDSGGPAFASRDGRLVLVGVVSGADSAAACDPSASVLIAPVTAAFGWLRFQLRRRLPRAVPPSSRCRARRRALSRTRRRDTAPSQVRRREDVVIARC